MSYVPLVYKSCGGDQFNIASGGVLSLAGQAITTTGAITGNTVTPTAGVIESIQVMTSSDGTLTGYGLSVVKSSAGEIVTHEIEPLGAGYVKYISCPNCCATTGALKVTTTGTWNGTNNQIVFSSGNTNVQCVIAISRSTALWSIVAKTTDVTFATV